MSYFAAKLEDLMKAKDLSQTDLARRSGVSQAQISRLLSSFQRSISSEDLARILESVSRDPRQRAELICARMQDQCNGPGSELIEVRIEDKPVAFPAKRHPPDPPILARLFVLFRAHYRDNPGLRSALEGLGGMLDQKGIPDNASESPIKHPDLPQSQPKSETILDMHDEVVISLVLRRRGL